MQFNATVVRVDGPEAVNQGKKKYKQLEVFYNKDGKEEKKKLVDFNNPEIFNRAAALQPGQNVSIQIEKQGDYWNWVGLGVGEGKAMAAEPNKRSAGTFETAEERAKKQVYIVRQSSISNAIEWLALSNRKDWNLDDVLVAAKEFENYVFGEVEEKEAF